MEKMDADPPRQQYESIAVNDKDIHKIVLSYLVHGCFKDTLDSFVACTGEEHPVSRPEDMDTRKKIYNYVLNGNASKAIELTKKFTPGLLEKNKDLHFDLLSLQFVEILRSVEVGEVQNYHEAIQFAKTNLTSFGKEDKKYVDKIKEFITLIAYLEPEKSPVFHLLSSEQRLGVADSLNRAILAHTNLPSYSALERVIQQTTVVRRYLSQDFGKLQADDKSQPAESSQTHTAEPSQPFSTEETTDPTVGPAYPRGPPDWWADAQRVLLEQQQMQFEAFRAQHQRMHDELLAKQQAADQRLFDAQENHHKRMFDAQENHNKRMFDAQENHNKRMFDAHADAYRRFNSRIDSFEETLARLSFNRSDDRRDGMS